MPVSIQMPGKIRSPIDAIGDALNVVSQVYGIKANAEALERAKFEQAAKQEEMDRMKKGILTKRDQFMHGDKYEWSETPGKDTVEFMIDDGNGNLTPAYAKAKKTDISPLLAGQLAGQALDNKRKANELRTTPENQEVVTGLAKKNASKLAIANQIDSVTSILDDPNIPDDQKTLQGRQLIKVLNSTEGADAVGAEEAKRLGSLLEFKILNLTEPGPVFGRAPISEFSSQAKLTGNGIKAAIRANQAQIDDILAGKTPQMMMAETPQRAGAGKSPLIPDAKAGASQTVTAEDLEMLQKAKAALKADPNDSKAKQVMGILSAKGLR